ncbi:unnamed protein product [Heligmosomoides polygyrus]|uniref:Bet_v_1 domain-containing protein n=1 Tax=Heligmosomoides polygyrus TaxID=6339 RepID=A0A183GVA5_HELPZ|nr:unnamed protein product [Heligmosomoides polygyrus]
MANEEVEVFYVDLEKFYKEGHTFHKVIVGKFNAKIGPRRSPDELHIGTHRLEWNEQGEGLSQFIMSTKTIHGNSQFQKPPSLRWTWETENVRLPAHLSGSTVPSCANIRLRDLGYTKAG